MNNASLVTLRKETIQNLLEEARHGLKALSAMRMTEILQNDIKISAEEDLKVAIEIAESELISNERLV